MRFFVTLFSALLSGWGLLLIAALDSSMIFYLPFAVDAAVIILTSRFPEFFWLYPIIATAGSLSGAAVTYYIGRRIGEVGLEHYVPRRQLRRFRQRIEAKGAVGLAVLDMAPPPFPFTACVLAAGALEVNVSLFLIVLGITRLVRFGGEAVLAYFYGSRIIHWIEAPVVQDIGAGLFAVAVIGAVIGVVQLIRKRRFLRDPDCKKAA